MPLQALDAQKKQLRITAGGRSLVLRYDKANGMIDCPQPGKGVTCITGFYFALRAFYPKEKIYQPLVKKR